MSLVLFVLGYLALPLLVGFVYWRAGRKAEAVWWALACIAAPFVLFMLTMAIMSPTIQGEGLGHAAVAGFVGAFGWLVLGVAGLILTARTPKAKPAHE